jgi:D-alanine-D-alanine ligase
VGLVFNLKGETEEDLAGSEADSRPGGAQKGILVAPPAKAEKTRTDTYAEWDTQETIDAVHAALSSAHTVTPIEANEEAFERLRATRPDIVFNIAEGLNGVSREAQIPAMLEMLGIPYTGSDPVTLGICLDKARTKEILSYHRIPTPAFTVVSQADELSVMDVPLPAIVKPLHEGSSKGIHDNSVVRPPAELFERVKAVVEAYGQPALVEQFLPGREFTVALLGNGSNLTVLPIIETRFDSLPSGVNPIYSYEAKWIWDQQDHPIDVHECPAHIDEALKQEIEQICRQAFTILACRDWCRVDVRLDQRGKPHIIELNPLPGILPDPEDHSCFPLAARTAGLGYAEMLNAFLEAGARRYGLL